MTDSRLTVTERKLAAHAKHFERNDIEDYVYFYTVEFKHWFEHASSSDLELKVLCSSFFGSVHKTPRLSFIQMQSYPFRAVVVIIDFFCKNSGYPQLPSS